MDQLKWAAIYVLAFALSVGGGVMLATWKPGYGGFAGIDSVTWDDSVGTAVTDLTYGPKPLNTFDLYLPADKTKSANKLVIYIHAGGFRAGDKADDESFGHAFTAMGYVTATINYSLNTDSDPVSVDTMTREIKQGVDAIVAAAKERGYPVDAMAIGGGSAGGHLAMTYAYCDAATAPVPVTMVMNFVGPPPSSPASGLAWTTATTNRPRRPPAS